MFDILPNNIKSPFQYPGGKYYARNKILKYIPNHNVYIEPFAGSASIFFAKEKTKETILNDLDVELINTYIQIRDNPYKLIELLESTKPTKETFKYLKNTHIPKNNMEKAVRYFFLNRTYYSGIMNMKHCYFSYSEHAMRQSNWGKRILEASEKLQNVKLTSIDFEYIINNAPNNSFLFIDPPYFNTLQNKMYEFGFTEKEHIRLLEVLKNNKYRLNFLLTYDNDITIKNMYSWANTNSEEWTYTMNRADYTGRYKGKELFITNYNLI